jgi:hypothetical protein
MRFRLLDAVTLAGNPAKPNEDSHVETERFAAVFDGATGLGERLMPGPSDAQWIANFGARRLKAHADACEGSPRDWLRTAASDAAKSFAALRLRAPAENYEFPFASLMLATLAGDRLNALWLGDCAALVRAPSGALTFIGETLARRGYERERAKRLAGLLGAVPAAPSVREKFLPALRASRNRVNTKDEWLFAPDPECADHAKQADMFVVANTLVLLATDGFLALVSDYECYTPETLVAAAQLHGLAALGEELRAIEAADPEGVRYPRFKASDDATALLLELSA